MRIYSERNKLREPQTNRMEIGVACETLYAKRLLPVKDIDRESVQFFFPLDHSSMESILPERFLRKTRSGLSYLLRRKTSAEIKIKEHATDERNLRYYYPSDTFPIFPESGIQPHKSVSRFLFYMPSCNLLEEESIYTCFTAESEILK